MIGENSGGGAHPVDFFSISDTPLSLGVPIGRTYDPETKQDWEGTGVEPDLRINPDLSFSEILAIVQDNLKTKKYRSFSFYSESIL